MSPTIAEPKQLYSQLNDLMDQIPRYKLMKGTMELMAQDKTVDGKSPGVFGEFGYDASNPVPA